MSKQKGPEEARKMTACFLARLALGDRREMSYRAFSELTGVSMSAIYRREEVGTKAKKLYLLICALAPRRDAEGNSMKKRIIAALEAIPKDARDDDAALMTVQSLAERNGFGPIVDKVRETREVDFKEFEELDVPETDTAEVLRVLEGFSKHLERRALDVPDRAARRYENASSAIVAALNDARRGYEEELAAREKEGGNHDHEDSS